MVALAPLSPQETSAAWTQSVDVAVPASSGAWSPAAAIGTCSVVTMSGAPVAGRSCTVTGVAFQSNGDGRPAGQRTGHMTLSLSTNAQSNGTEQVRLDLSLGATTGLPQDWVWADAGVVAGNLTAFPGYRCTTLAQPNAPFTGYAPGWVSTSGSAYFQVVENRSSGSNLVCS